MKNSTGLSSLLTYNKTPPPLLDDFRSQRNSWYPSQYSSESDIAECVQDSVIPIMSGFILYAVACNKSTLFIIHDKLSYKATFVPWACLCRSSSLSRSTSWLALTSAGAAWTCPITVRTHSTATQRICLFIFVVVVVVSFDSTARHSPRCAFYDLTRYTDHVRS